MVLAAACRRPEGPPPKRIAPAAVERSGTVGRRRISRLYPERTAAGAGFNVQKGGDSALLVAGWGFTAEDRISWNGEPLVTAFGDATQISAVVPKALCARPGKVRVEVKRRTGSPETVSSTFTVEAR